MPTDPKSEDPPVLEASGYCKSGRECTSSSVSVAVGLWTGGGKGRVLETADAFLDDKADRLWRTRSAALRELAQKVRDGTDLVLLCAGRIESCHGDLLKKGILAEAAQLEATSKRKPRSDKGKPRGPRGPRADSVETAARIGVLSTFYLRHAYGRDSPRLHEESGVLSAPPSATPLRPTPPSQGYATVA
ncbi:hypothetical protein EMIHUDRAFT_226990 [Emiliania huxleyi CCMP1516]|uniref:Uncharacterized protein n=2 Tax=Emiliania huxleyi TaxID=2903 RepID=A0A0D3KK12_EMIH1|nr:hypothetical protein EMIHUDRAFT_226990 [Emiliania huxleyi CCMP1516]EOD36097.1 hypothetical protein EMIHUDRAFT_226990 [Emiliania huxleyi CCMP1516]|eukprot:XP_005788526.1 hypothetical protein EMIHUDRAFT_226990 [Emiliania huxleyi CCMP1516]